MQEGWDGVYDEASYAAARKVLEEDRKHATGELKALLSKRSRIVVVVVILWAIGSAAAAVANPDLLLVAEIGWVVIVGIAVFCLMPAITGRSNLEELYGQYEARLAELEEARVPLPTPSDMPDLVAALDYVKLPE